MTNNIIELRLPLKPEYLVILRGITGLAAGVALFNYEEIKQLRVAVSEVFDLATKHATQVGQVSEVNELVVRISPHPNRMEILIMGPKDYTSYLGREEGMESLVLLRSVVDEVEFGGEVIGKTQIRLIKYRSKAEASEERMVREEAAEITGSSAEEKEPEEGGQTAETRPPSAAVVPQEEAAPGMSTSIKGKILQQLMEVPSFRTRVMYHLVKKLG